MSLLDSIRSPRKPTEENQEQVQPQQSKKQNPVDSKNPRPHYTIVPMFQSKREAMFWLIMSMNVGGSTLTSTELVNKAEQVVNTMEERNLACWYRKRQFPPNGSNSRPDSTPRT